MTLPVRAEAEDEVANVAAAAAAAGESEDGTVAPAARGASDAWARGPRGRMRTNS